MEKELWLLLGNYFQETRMSVRGWLELGKLQGEEKVFISSPQEPKHTHPSPHPKCVLSLMKT